MTKIPPFTVTRTLLAFDDQEIDLNEVSLNFPDGTTFTLNRMSEPRAKAQQQRWNELAAKLSKLWEGRK